MSKQQITRVEKPWGHELIWGKTPDYVGKLLFIKKGHKLSLQYHQVKEETIFLQSGLMTFV
ncbi:cupin, partial [bacterium]|nr:cupin [bacterium]